MLYEAKYVQKTKNRLWQKHQNPKLWVELAIIRGIKDGVSPLS